MLTVDCGARTQRTESILNDPRGPVLLHSTFLEHLIIYLSNMAVVLWINPELLFVSEQMQDLRNKFEEERN